MIKAIAFYSFIFRLSTSSTIIYRISILKIEKLLIHWVAIANFYLFVLNFYSSYSYRSSFISILKQKLR
jgi:hypothetical protein